MFIFPNQVWRVLSGTLLAASAQMSQMANGPSVYAATTVSVQQSQSESLGSSQSQPGGHSQAGTRDRNEESGQDKGTHTPKNNAIKKLGSEKNRYYYEKRGEAIWDVPTKTKAIALTFDDGPNPVYTPKLLKLLKEYNAHATFFVIGSRVAQYPDLIRQEFEEGHEIANHTYNHHNIKTMSQEALIEEIDETQEIVTHTTGKAPVLFRPPTGYYDPKVINAAKANHCLVVIWSWDQDTRDWGNASAPSMISHVLKHLDNGDIILFHDKAGNRKQTLQAISAILPEAQKRGYKCLTVSELLKLRKQERLSARQKGHQDGSPTPSRKQQQAE